jgi:hypothetical protein
MKKSRVFYEALLAAKAPTELGLAIRDGVPFEKLKDDSVATVAMAVSLYEKGLAKLLEELAKVPDPVPSNGAAEAPVDAPAPPAPAGKKGAPASAKP